MVNVARSPRPQTMREMDVENTPPDNTANRESLIREKSRPLHRIAWIDKMLGSNAMSSEWI